MNPDLNGKPENMDELSQWAVEHLWAIDRPTSTFLSGDDFTVFTDAEGCRIRDASGKEYIDYWAGIMTNSVGYGRIEIADAAYEQLRRLHFPPTHEPTIPKIKLAKKLADVTPGSCRGLLRHRRHRCYRNRFEDCLEIPQDYRVQ